MFPTSKEVKVKCSLTPLIADGNCFGGWDENVENYTHQNKYTFFILYPFDVVVVVDIVVVVVSFAHFLLKQDFED